MIMAEEMGGVGRIRATWILQWPSAQRIEFRKTIEERTDRRRTPLRHQSTCQKRWRCSVDLLRKEKREQRKGRQAQNPAVLVPNRETERRKLKSNKVQIGQKEENICIEYGLHYVPDSIRESLDSGAKH